MDVHYAAVSQSHWSAIKYAIRHAQRAGVQVPVNELARASKPIATARFNRRELEVIRDSGAPAAFFGRREARAHDLERQLGTHSRLWASAHHAAQHELHNVAFERRLQIPANLWTYDRAAELIDAWNNGASIVAVAGKGPGQYQGQGRGFGVGDESTVALFVLALVGIIGVLAYQ